MTNLPIRSLFGRSLSVLGCTSASWSRQCSYESESYHVRKARLLENWKTNNSAIASEFHHARSLLFFNKQPLMHRGKVDRAKMFITWVENRQLRKVLMELGLELRAEMSVLLGVCMHQSTNTTDTLDQFQPSYAVSIRHKDSIAQQLLHAFEGEFYDLRLAMLSAGADEAQLLSKAQTMLRWTSVFKHCPKCTKPLESTLSKCVMTCSNCDEQYYPPLSPVAQCLIEDINKEHCLLVMHNRTQVNGMFTAVAGFAEPGESIEQCAQREVAEEVGIDVSGVRYFGDSQHWPYPHSSLMLPFLVTGDMRQPVQINSTELLDAGWFSKAEVQRALDNTHALNFSKPNNHDSKLWCIPPPGTMAYTIIRRWLDV